MLPVIEQKIKSLSSSYLTAFIAVSVVIIIAITCSIALLGYKSIHSLSTINMHSIEKNKELKRLDVLIGKVRELHSDVRDFVLTRDSSTIRHNSQDKQLVMEYTRQFVDSLQAGREKNNMMLLSQLINRKIALDENVLKLYQLGGRDIALEFIETGRSGALSDSIELVANNIKEFENLQLENSVRTYDKAAIRTRFIIIVASCLIILLGLVFMITTIRNLQRRAAIMAELEIAKVASEKAALLKTQFMSNMSHEIRTPLNSIIGFTNLLAHTPLNQEQTDYVTTAKGASENLLRIVNDVLDFSKIEAGMLTPQRREFNVREILQNVGKLFGPAASNSNLQLVINCHTSVPLTCIGDAGHLNQVLINLVGNAIKFTEKGSVTVSISAKQAFASHIILKCSIVDTGVGIPPSKLPLIFDRFQQIDNNATRKYTGTGLGLAIVRSLVELEGGSIEVNSTEAIGTEFTFTINYGLPAENAGAAAIKIKPVDGNTHFKGSILLAEDNSLNQKLAAILFKKWNIDFDIAANGKIACQMVQQKQYALVLMDIQMPEMDGYQATSIIRKQLKMQMPIVALTAYVLDNETSEFAKAGMNGHLTKPFSEEELHNTISKFLEVEPALKNEAAGSELYFAELERIAGGNKANAKELALTFIEQIELEINQIEIACRQKDLQALSSIAHSMRSTIGYIGLGDKLFEPLQQLEKPANNTWNEEMANKSITEIKSITGAVVKILQEKLAAYVAD